jgi:hypothetical protein
MVCPDLMLIWHMCMSREFPLVGHTNISIEDWWLFSCLDLVIGPKGCEFFINSKSVRDPFVNNDS